MSGAPGSRAAASPRLRVGRAEPAPPRRPRRSRRAPASRSRRARPHRADGVEGRGQQRALERDQGVEVGGLPAPPGLGPPAQRTQAGARRVDEDPVERSRRPRRPGAVADDDAEHSVRARQRPSHQTGPVRLTLVGDQAGAPLGGQRREQGRLAAGAGAQVEPQPVGPSRGAAASARATSWEPSSWTPARPSATAATAPGSPDARWTPYGDQRVGSPGSSSRVERPGRATSVTPGASLSAASSASISLAADGRGQRLDHPAGVGVRHRQVAHPVVAGVGATRSTQPSRSCSLTRRSTALANPAAPGPTSERTSATVVEIAACAGTRIASSWCAPSRSASSTRACTLASGRSTQAASTASYRPCRRTVPDDELGRERRVAPGRAGAPPQGGGQGEVRVRRRPSGPARSTSSAAVAGRVSQRCSLTSFFGALDAHASVMISSSSWRESSPSRDCWTSTAL